MADHLSPRAQNSTPYVLRSVRKYCKRKNDIRRWQYDVFHHLDWLKKGDETHLEVSAGVEYLYRVTRRLVVGLDTVEVMNAVEGRSLVTLQTCTLPDYERNLIVQGELVEENA